MRRFGILKAQNDRLFTYLGLELSQAYGLTFYLDNLSNVRAKSNLSDFVPHQRKPTTGNGFHHIRSVSYMHCVKIEGGSC